MIFLLLLLPLLFLAIVFKSGATPEASELDGFPKESVSDIKENQ